MERRQIRFRGRVQGVGFRATARAVAVGFPVSGWIQNEADGTVLMEVQGPAAAVGAFLAAFREHYQRHVTGESAALMAVLETESLFDIRR